MVGLVGLFSLAVIVAVHTLVAAVSVRLFRVRFTARWTPIAFAVVAVPLLLIASTLVVAGGLGLGPDLGSARLVWFLFVAAPLGLGLAVDYLWMPPPEAVELPAPRDD